MLGTSSCDTRTARARGLHKLDEDYGELDIWVRVCPWVRCSVSDDCLFNRGICSAGGSDRSSMATESRWTMGNVNSSMIDETTWLEMQDLSLFAISLYLEVVILSFSRQIACCYGPLIHTGIFRSKSNKCPLFAAHAIKDLLSVLICSMAQAVWFDRRPSKAAQMPLSARRPQEDTNQVSRIK